MTALGGLLLDFGSVISVSIFERHREIRGRHRIIWYESIYSQFSSVSHYDRYSIELLGIQPAPDGTLVLAAQPHWPKLPSMAAAGAQAKRQAPTRCW